MKWIDSHCHLTDPRLDQIRDEWILEAAGYGIDFFMQGGIGPEDWICQRALAARYPGKLGLCFGLHPYWVADHSLEECEAALDLLARDGAGDQCLALGEMGLDLRSQILKAPQGEEASIQAKQIEVFTLQLELAEVLNKPIVLHVVQAHEMTQTIFDQVFDHGSSPRRGQPPKGGLVHSFNGSWAQAEKYLERGLLISVGGPLCRASARRLEEVVKQLPLDRLLLETDAPDQPPDRLRGQMNPLASLIEVARRVAELKKMDIQEILEASKNNFVKLMGL